jgi:tetratricopeptide (TPR) repeat protein
MPINLFREQSRRGSRRLRRVTWTLSILATLLAISAIVTWRVRRDNQPDEYVPGENSKDVTNVEMDRATKASSAATAQPKVEVGRPAADPLINPDQKRPQGAPGPYFTDVTKEAGLASFRQFQGQRTSQLPEDMGSGVAWGDFDNDGLDDLFVVSGGGPMDAPASQLAPSVLYRNLGNGKFEKVQDFPDLRIHGMSATWADFNNDGWLDLIVTGYDTIILFRNDHGHLVRDKAFPSPKGFWAGASWGDFNHDGYLDLYICGYVKYKPNAGSQATSKQFDQEVPFTLNPASYEAERNLLYRNNGDGTFTEVAKEMGVANPEGRSLGALWHDFNGDGWPDLYVANDISENKLYVNHHGKFVDSGKDAWVEEYRGSMGLASGDYNRDGFDDLFISHWIAQGDALYQGLPQEKKGIANKSRLHFTDVAALTGVGNSSMQKIGWGTSFVDIDSDGWLDLLVANGSTFEQKEGTPRRLVPMSSFLFWNDHGDFFYDLAPWNRSFSQTHVSRGLAVADYNNDGAMDVAIVDQGEGVRLLRNDIPQGHWVELRLHNRVPPSNAPIGFGDGATVIAWVKGVALRRYVGSSSYLSQDSHRIHIGLGAAAKIDRLEVHWPSGGTETRTNLDANQIFDITQGEPQAKVFTIAHSADGQAANAASPTGQTGIVQFWAKQHAAMDAMKRDRDFTKAAQLFREALAINPNHEDSHYYLANCLAALGDIPAAVAELDALARINPQNHRAYQRKGELLASSATSRSQLQSAHQALNSALKLNSEETGTLVLLGEVTLAQGDMAAAEQNLSHACQANSRAANAWFFRGYIAWKRRDIRQASTMLAAAHSALGPDWKPSGSVLEGDVRQRMYSESGFLGLFEQQWDGSTNPVRAYAQLDTYLRRLR